MRNEAIWHFELFGGLTVRRGKYVITRFKYRKVGALLAYLAFFPKRAHAREVLIDQFWPDASLEAGRNNLSTALSSLRHQLEPPGIASGTILRADRYTVGLNAEAIEVDVAVFEAAIEQANRATDPVRRLDCLEQAILKYSGPLLPGFYESWIVPEQERLAGLFSGAVTQAAALREQQGRIAVEPMAATVELRRSALSDARTMTLLVGMGTGPERELLERHGGQLLGIGSGTFVAAFAVAQSALWCACDMANSIAPVQLALHTGAIGSGKEDSTTARLALRILSTAQSGQILLSEATAILARSHLPPETRTVDLGQFRLSPSGEPDRIFRLDYPGMPGTAGSMPQGERYQGGSIPVAATRYFGREADIAKLMEMLTAEKRRLVTITGTGGIGKTRFSLEVAHRLAANFPGAIWFVALASVMQPDLIPAMLVETLGLSGAGSDPLEVTVAALSGQTSLLILDNCEHLIEATAELVGILLARVPGLTILTTSRLRLNLPGEWEFPLSELELPVNEGTLEQMAQIESIALFVDRAQAALSHFQLTVRNGSAVGELCRRLEGIPLALELAASRVATISPARMVEQLSRRFDFLVTRQRGLPERHRSLLAAIEWSYQLLEPDDQRFFGSLSVFRGGCTVEAAAFVCDDPLAGERLALLRECSLVVREETEQGPRFRLLETLREFGDTLLSDEERCLLEKRHLEYFVALCEEAEPHLCREDQLWWHDRLKTDEGNIRIAMNRAEPGNPEACLRIYGALALFWLDWANPTLNSEQLAALLERCPEPTVIRARALQAAGGLGQTFAEQFRYLEEALTIYRQIGQIQGIADTLLGLGTVYGEVRDYDRAETYFRESLPLHEQLDDLSALGRTFCRQGLACHMRGELEGAQCLFERSLDLSRKAGDLFMVASTSHYLAALLRSRSRFEEAHRWFAEGLDIVVRLRQARWIPAAMGVYATSLAEIGEFDRAFESFEQALYHCDQIHDINWRAQTLELYGNALRRSGDFDAAYSRLSEALRIRYRNPEDSTIVIRLMAGFTQVATGKGDFRLAALLLAFQDRVQNASGVSNPDHRPKFAELVERGCNSGFSKTELDGCWEEGHHLEVGDVVARLLRNGH